MGSTERREEVIRTFVPSFEEMDPQEMVNIQISIDEEVHQVSLDISKDFNDYYKELISAYNKISAKNRSRKANVGIVKYI